MKKTPLKPNGGVPRNVGGSATWSSSDGVTSSSGPADTTSHPESVSNATTHSYQWQEDPYNLLTHIMRTQQKLLDVASKEGAYYTGVYARMSFFIIFNCRSIKVVRLASTMSNFFDFLPGGRVDTHADPAFHPEE